MIGFKWMTLQYSTIIYSSNLMFNKVPILDCLLLDCRLIEQPPISKGIYFYIGYYWIRKSQWTELNYFKNKGWKLKNVPH